MRSFSGLYFLLGITAYFIVLSHAMSSYLFISQWFAIGTGFFITTLVMTIAKLYQKAYYMNHLDALLLSNCTIFCYVLPFSFCTQSVVRMFECSNANHNPYCSLHCKHCLENLFKSYMCKLKSPLCIQDSFNCFRSKRMPIAVEST